MIQQILTATDNTFLKKRPFQAVDLSIDEKREFKKGDTFGIDAIYFLENEDEPDQFLDGHYKIKGSYNSGEWYIYPPHWSLPSQVAMPEKEVEKIKAKPFYVYPTISSVNWNDFSDRVSKYFTVGEVTNMSRERIPTDRTVKKNILAVAKELDKVREWYGQGLIVTSWHRPPAINRAIGGARYSKHIKGHAVDFRPADGNVYGLQRRFENEWYRSGKWQGGFGRGANRSFIHLDLGSRRIWNY